MNEISQTNCSPVSPPVRLCLVGFMGAGKTATAQILAEKSGVNWIDLDEFIEARESRPVRQIIDALGEQVFREIETDALREVVKMPDANILALGGGTWTIGENRRIIENADYRSIWLDTGFELCWKRIFAAAVNNRPLARSKTEARRLFGARRAIYQTARFHIKITKNKAPEAVAREIIKLTAAA